MYKDCGNTFKGCSPTFATQEPACVKATGDAKCVQGDYNYLPKSQFVATNSNWVMSLADPKDVGMPAYSVIGILLGFGVFFSAYIITVIMIFRDVAASKVKYEEMIQEDIVNLSNLSINSGDLEEELKIRLEG